jgi:hypothetical protein
MNTSFAHTNRDSVHAGRAPISWLTRCEHENSRVRTNLVSFENLLGVPNL